MQFEQIVQRLGAQIVKQDVADSKVVLMLRVRTDDVTRSKWAGFIEEALVREELGKRKAWTLDISQAYYLASGSPRYLWRLVIQGKTKKAVGTALDALYGAAMQSLSAGVEVTSMPLVGRDNYAGAKTRGVHNVGDAGGLIGGR